jgi:hypothetical protein
LLNGICYVIANCCRKFDLKGSTVDREASDKEKEKDLPTLKDNDFVKEGMKIYIGDDAKEKLLETLTADVEVCWVLFSLICESVLCVSFGHNCYTLTGHFFKVGMNIMDWMFPFFWHFLFPCYHYYHF